MSRFCRLLMCVVTWWCCIPRSELQADPLDEWVIRPPPFALQLFDVIYANGLFVAVGMDYDGMRPRLIVSPNGANWTGQINGSQMTMRSLAYGNGTFVAVGTLDAACCKTPGVVVSTNGFDWKFWPNAVTNAFSAVTFGNGRFVAAGSGGRVAVSTNGTNWVTGNSATPLDLAGIAYGNGLFVATVSSTDAGPGEVERSPDGVNWTTQRPFNGGRIMFAREIFVTAAGYMPPAVATIPIQVSGNAVTWTAATADTNDLPRGFAYVGGIFVDVGTRGLIEVSTDGTNWVRRNSGTTARFNAVAHGNGTFVAVGDLIMQSSAIGPHLKFEECCPEDVHTYHLLVSGVSNSLAQIYASTNLAAWQPLGSPLRLNGGDTEVFRSGASLPARYFRAQLVP